MRRPQHRSQHQCFVCTKCFPTRDFLSNHVALAHGSTDEYVSFCIYCDLRDRDIFTNYQRLALHIRLQHGTERPFPCATCDYLFRTSDERSRHPCCVGQHDQAEGSNHVATPSIIYETVPTSDDSSCENEEPMCFDDVDDEWSGDRGQRVSVVTVDDTDSEEEMGETPNGVCVTLSGARY